MSLYLSPVFTIVCLAFEPLLQFSLYFDESALPSALAWLPRASPVKLAWEGLVANEFHGLIFSDAASAAGGSSKAKIGSSGPRAYSTGDEVNCGAPVSPLVFLSCSSVSFFVRCFWWQ